MRCLADGALNFYAADFCALVDFSGKCRVVVGNHYLDIALFHGVFGKIGKIALVGDGKFIAGIIGEIAVL